MKVLHVIPSLAVVHGGPSKAIQLIERALMGRGVEIDVVTTDDDGPGRRIRNVAPGWRRTDTSVAKRQFFAKLTEFYKFSPALAVWLFRHARDYDLIHIHALFSFSSIAAAVAARYSKVPYIIRPLGTLNHYGLERRRPWLKKFSLRWLDGPALRNAAAVQFTAEAEREEAQKLGIPFRAAVVPLAVDTAPEASTGALLTRFPNLLPDSYIVFLSRIDPKKNVEALIDAIALLTEEHPRLKLAIVGDGKPEYLNSLKQRGVALGIHNRIVWTGFLDGGLKTAALAGATMFVLPSLSENFGIAVAEALLSGLPCVLGKGVAIASEVQAAGAGLMVNPDAASTARAVNQYLIDPALRGDAGIAARRLALEKYSVESMGLGLLALYRDVLSRTMLLSHSSQD